MQKARCSSLRARFVGVGAVSLQLVRCRPDGATARVARPPPAAAPPMAPDPGPTIPEGFTPIFNGKDLTGWHVSKTNHHGTTPDYRVLHGLIVGTQNPKGQGGILLTDKNVKNFEVYMEIKPDWGCDSGLFRRSSEAGEAYQVTLDYLPGGGMGGIYGERLTGAHNRYGRREAERRKTRGAGEAPRGNVAKSVEARGLELGSGANRRRRAPHHAWINDQLITDFTDTANHAAGGATEGMIAIQMHFSNEKTPRWVDGGFWRWRTIAVKELPAQ